MSRVCIIGLDCLTPQLVFDQSLNHLPYLKQLLSQSAWGRLESSMPPITIPAWSAMVTGCDPGQLGIYGFRNRRDRSYTRRVLPSSLSLPLPTLWQVLTDHHRRSRVLTVPQTYPARPLNGTLIAGFPVPDFNGAVSHPPELWDTVRARHPDFQMDVEDFRYRAPAEVYEEVVRMTNARFEVAERWVSAEDWDLFMMVEMGPDRLHHSLWDLTQPDHPAYDADHPLSGAMLEYYRLLDSRLGRLLSQLRDDDLLLVVSDHGAQAMRGAFALNQWLVEKGHLVLTPDHPTSGPLVPQHVDWEKTRAFGDGGYVGRIYFNVQGREPRGCLLPEQVPGFVEKLRKQLQGLPGPEGSNLQTQALSPEEAYGPSTRGVPPDLTLLVEDLSFRVLGTLGHPDLMVNQNDRGHDGANHAQHGIVIARAEALPPGQRAGLSLYDIAPTVLHHLQIPVPPHMKGLALQSKAY